ncbi:MULTISPECIES: hypothetical protein [Comamonas]|nr:MULTISPECIES: hypothetical protein [Comamonas]UUC91559.1 hypothetical protein NOX35_14680 [Comamonas sp. C11]WEE75401.1 hypothetical protein LZ683_14515 [Comamonas testosteroni]
MSSKITVTAPLNAAAAERHARRIAIAYVIAACGVAAAGLAALVLAIRWW